MKRFISKIVMLTLVFSLCAVPNTKISAKSKLHYDSINCKVVNGATPTGARVIGLKHVAKKHPYRNYRSLVLRNRFSNSQRALFDTMDTVCLSFIQSKENGLKYAKYNTITIPTGIKTTFSTETIKDVYSIFKISNPQYYFLSNT